MLCYTIQWHTQATDETPILNIQSRRHEDMEQEKTRNRFPLAVLLEVDLQNYRVPTSSRQKQLSTKSTHSDSGNNLAENSKKCSMKKHYSLISVSNCCTRT